MTDAAGKTNSVSFGWTVNTTGGSVFENTTGVPVPDVGGPVTSPIIVVRTGNAPANLQVSVDISHTYRGDLTIDLVAPDGTSYRLKHYNIVDSLDDVKATYHDRPWLLNLNFTTPHWPWLAEGGAATGATIAAKIRSAKSHDEVVGALNHYDGGSVAKYTEMVESLDAAVGEVLAALRRSGQEDDTLVLFASDNGGERFSYNWPLSGEKFALLEGGIRVPTILRWPSRINPHQVSHEPNFSPDWTATLLEVGGARPDPAYPLDGTSLAGYLLRGEAPRERDLFWRVRDNRALRRGGWKYYQDADGKDHLFNLARDVREQADLAPDRPELLAELKTAWERTAETLLPYPAA